MPTIIKYPNKTDYVFGKDTSIHLACKSDGNLKPSYYWYKENPREHVGSNENFTITIMNITNSGTYTCEVNNTFHGDTYKKAAIVKIKIINAADKSTPSTSGSGDNEEKGIYKTVIDIYIHYSHENGACIYYYRKEDNKSGEKTGSNMNPVESQKTTLGAQPTNSTQKTTGYGDVDLDDTDMNFKPTSNEETIAQLKQHNEEYLKKQKEDEDKEKDNPYVYKRFTIFLT
ncbi:unnamed protein product [Mytilus coruscus]|uniref:Ig-like domain-containing protein n=1 Tax=Mytilus coruscus TaxID=42192 RepID=A0A6J8EFD3_MYTCO|nr:unnamed protein product [Mytilus coruscus]